MSQVNDTTMYDTIIIGGGPGGLSAAIYAARARMKTLVLELKSKTGGQAGTTSELENYPGFASATGPEVMQKFREHAEKFGAEFKKAKVTGIETAEDGFTKIIKSKKENFSAKTVIIATGAEPRVLGIKGEKEFRGAGVSYCATCDADFFEDLDIVVVGSGNTAVEEAIFLTKFVNKITMIVIHDEGTMDADKIAQEHALGNAKINFVWNSTVAEIGGEDMVDHVMLKNIKSNETSKLDCDGVFMFVGTVPRTEFVEDNLELTPDKYIPVNLRMETSTPGIFACGDVTDKFLRQVVTAAGDGAVAAVAAEKYIEEEENWKKSVLSSEKPVLVAFWSPVKQESVDTITNLEALIDESVKLVKIDAYKNTRVASRYNVTELPTVLRLEKGEVVSKTMASQTEELKKIV